MKTFIRSTLAILALVVFPTLAQAACSVEYKAKKDNPLKLTYGSISVANCSQAAAEAEARAALAAQGWILLKVLSIKGSNG